MTTFRMLGAVLVLGLFLSGCASEEFTPTAVGDAATAATPGAVAYANADDPEAQISAMIDDANLTLEGEGVQILMGEWVGNPDGGIAGGTVIAKDVGNKRLTADFVPFDGRRTWSGAAPASDNVTYAIDQTGDAVPFFGGLTGAETDAAIERGTASWEALNCSALPQFRNPDFGLDIGYVAAILSGGTVGSFNILADVQHAGWRDLNFAGGVLGVTFTFIFTGVSGPTDIDGNGLADTAFREIYYDPSWNWADDGSSNIDVETVAVHEIGHGLSQAHFGTVRIKNNGDVQASPRAVMNALYNGPYRTLAGTDNGGHCSNWANWPYG
ncbi:hypothetical protein [Rubrivirga sp. IMCC45206]|uniref:hypothetical protein n=1 Tax=Rubrivirga sp. IMCC45206 TaxID=3391614 RepID=UPI00398FC397